MACAEQLVFYVHRAVALKEKKKTCGLESMTHPPGREKWPDDAKPAGQKRS
jgi:hypothetical protein